MSVAVTVSPPEIAAVMLAELRARRAAVGADAVNMVSTSRQEGRSGVYLDYPISDDPWVWRFQLDEWLSVRGSGSRGWVRL